MPATFKYRIKGMGGGDEFPTNSSGQIAAQLDWIEDALDAADAAERAVLRSEAKETVNRRLDPYIYAHTLQTATQDIWLNFFGLRLDSGADPTIQLFAQKCFQVYKDTTPKLLEVNEWHLPFVEGDECFHNSSPDRMWTYGHWVGQNITCIDIAKQLSAARCAHLSYNDLETGQKMTVERALSIYDKLVGSRPLHASPMEHIATPDKIYTGGDGLDFWGNPGDHGNFNGWRQYRKFLLGEAVAELPEGFTL